MKWLLIIHLRVDTLLVQDWCLSIYWLLVQVVKCPVRLIIFHSPVSARSVTSTLLRNAWLMFANLLNLLDGVFSLGLPIVDIIVRSRLLKSLQNGLVIMKDLLLLSKPGSRVKAWSDWASSRFISTDRCESLSLASGTDCHFRSVLANYWIHLLKKHLVVFFNLSASF